MQEPIPLTKAHAANYRLVRGGKDVTKAEIAKYVNQEGKSCHQCMQRTINMPCTNKNDKGHSCFMSFCSNCYGNYYGYLTPQEMCSKCPKCLDTCVCRKCMRERPLNVEECKGFAALDADTQAKHARHTLDHVSGYLVNVRGQLAAERRAHTTVGEPPEIPEMLPGGTYRLAGDGSAPTPLTPPHHS